MPTRTFLIDTGDQQLPVNVSPEALHDFSKRAVGDMDRRIRHLSDTRYGPNHYMVRTNRLGVVAPLIYDAITRNDHERIVLMVLWLNTHFPEITGVEVGDEKIEYLSNQTAEEAAASQAHPERPKYLH